MIEVHELTRRFGRVVAVDRATFSIGRGEVVGFLGPNGAGKTTTMRVLTGYLPPTSGAVRVAGFDVVRASMEVRRRIGYLPEAVPLYGELRVEEMLAFQGRLHRLDRATLRRRTGEVLERVGLAERRRSLVATLSKGMRQRVGLAVALLPDPEVLILDEPTSGLDPLQRVEVRRLVAELASERTVLVSSHVLPEVEAVCGRVLVLHRGRVAADGTPAELAGQLGGGAVRVEAVVPDPAEAARLFGALPGVRAVRDRGPAGLHRAFDVVSDEDVREDVGALAAQRGWALRELSLARPTLEQLFARIALDLDPRGEDAGGEPGPPGPGPRPEDGAPGPGAQQRPAPTPLPVLNPFAAPPEEGRGG